MRDRRPRLCRSLKFRDSRLTRPLEAAEAFIRDLGIIKEQRPQPRQVLESRAADLRLGHIQDLKLRKSAEVLQTGIRGFRGFQIEFAGRATCLGA